MIKNCITFTIDLQLCYKEFVRLPSKFVPVTFKIRNYENNKDDSFDKIFYRNDSHGNNLLL